MCNGSGVCGGDGEFLKVGRFVARNGPAATPSVRLAAPKTHVPAVPVRNSSFPRPSRVTGRCRPSRGQARSRDADARAREAPAGGVSSPLHRRGIASVEKAAHGEAGADGTRLEGTGAKQVKQPYREGLLHLVFFQDGEFRRRRSSDLICLTFSTELVGKRSATFTPNQLRTAIGATQRLSSTACPSSRSRPRPVDSRA